VRSGRFARQWIRENAEGRPNYQKLLAEDLDRQIERVGAGLRARMPWLHEKRRSAPASAPRKAAKSAKRKPLKRARRARHESATAVRHAA